MDLTGKTVLVVGSGISGVAATELLKKKNVNVVLFDGNKELDLTALREKHPVFADRGDHRDQRQDDDHGALRRDHGKLLPGCESGRQYRNSIYLRGCGHHGRDSDGGGDQQLSAGDHSHISPGSFRYFKYHAGSSEPSSHDGVLY